ncbi:similar to Saccharomyces cerevisiae YHR161C YAP1801 Protein involved in clathrin cage assembly [Maudiozyma saulgeensis]|uniref:Similar to Saccharomyces cerevisiae YHR161C YAP1801 Protein involved in clathrin cage assembly n=1 Tax=Maudiozyma saulgeensis TaxID=1789683 RepID=A0A1X7R9U4_9SACH|nr:similar to Saccharomyces cerevisiae YHR161C YAP1801 Protein involved in clathrin cage assembly [Kazachstania saulgeensis]
MSPYMKLVKGATKIKVAPPKDKYMVPILNAIDNREEFNDIIYDIRVRIGNNKQQWSIVFKSLVVIHMMTQENPRIVFDYLSANLEFFNNMQVKIYNSNRKWATTDLSVMRRYSDYLECRSVEWDIMKRYSSESRPSNKERLRYVQSLERQILKLLRNKYSQIDLETDLFFFTYKLLVKDLLSLYNKLNEGVIKLLESFFDLAYEDAEITLDLYKRFVDVTESVVTYLRVGKALGLNIPVIKHITTKLIRSLEDHLHDRSNYTSKQTPRFEQKREPSRQQSIVQNDDDDNNNNYNNERIASTAAQHKYDEVQEEKRKLQQQLQQQQYLISPSTMSSNNPFSPQVDQFSFEPQPQQGLQATATGNPFLMQQPVQVSYTNSQYMNASPVTNAPPSYSVANTQVQGQSLAPARTTSMMINNPFGMDVLAENPGLMTDTTTGITYMPVPVQIAAVNPFEQSSSSQQQQQQQQQAPSGHTLRQDDSLVDL